MNGERYPAGKLPPELLGRMLSRYAAGENERLLVPPGIGEDAAVIRFGDRCVVAKTDPITFATDEAGWYAVHVNANDVAAMGATPRFFLASVILPEEQATEALIESVFRSIDEAARQLGIAVCGGHTEITHGIDRPIVVGQMLGDVDCGKVVRSSGLVPGDAVLLTKGMAVEATAIIAREKRGELEERGFEAAFLDRCAGYLRDPGISVVRDAAVATAAGEVHAMHDPTEGGGRHRAAGARRSLRGRPRSVRRPSALQRRIASPVRRVRPRPVRGDLLRGPADRLPAGGGGANPWGAGRSGDRRRDRSPCDRP